MPCVRILHLSDLHYTLKPSGHVKAFDQGIVLRSLLEDIDRNVATADKAVDLVVFSGDLVFSGDDIATFDAVRDVFIDPLCEKLRLPTTSFYCTPGNHDLSRDAIVEYVENGLTQQLQSLDSTNALIEEAIQDPTRHANVLARFTNFDQFNQKLASDGLIKDHLFGKTYNVCVGGIKVGIACLNSAWRSSGKGSTEKGRLILGERLIDLATQDLASSDIKIAVIHHPSSWLTEFDQVAVENRLQTEFSLILSGHAHRPNPDFRVSPLGGCVSLQAGTIYQHRDYLNAYQIIDIDLENDLVTMEVRSYFDDPSRCFSRAVNIGDSGFVTFPLPRDRASENTRPIRQFLNASRQAIRNQAKRAIILPVEPDIENRDIASYYVCPPLSLKREHEIVARSSIREGVFLSTETILTSTECYIVVGSGQSGKTSLCHYLAMRASEGVADRIRVPVVLKWVPNSNISYWLKRQLKNYFYEVDEQLPAEKLMEQGGFLFLIDDIKEFDEETYLRLHSDLKVDTGNRILILASDSELSAGAINDTKNILPKVKRVFIHSLPRKSIRALTRGIPEFSTTERSTYEFVINQIERAKLPRTGYIVSLILATLRFNRKLETPNEAILLENLIDLLLNKTQADGKKLNTFNFQSNMILLQQIALEMKKRPEGATQNDLCKITLDFLAEKGVEANATEIITSLLSSGLFNNDGQAVTFRYPCFQEYFIATKLRDTPSFLEQLSDSDELLPYRREVELYAGLNLQNPRLLEILSNQLRANIPLEVSAIATNWLSPMLIPDSALEDNRERLLPESEQQRSEDDIDNMLDDIDRRALSFSPPQPDVKKAPEDGVRIPVAFLASMDLCARCLRNLEFVDRGPKVTAITEILGLWAKFLTVYVTECDKLLKDPNRQAELTRLAPGKEKLVEHIIRIILPLAFTGIIADQIASPHIAKLLTDARKSVEPEEKVLFSDIGTQVLCVFLLLEGRSKNAFTFIRELISHNSHNTFLLLLIIEKLRLHYVLNLLTDAEKLDVRNLIIECYRLRGSVSKSASSGIQKTIERQLSKIDMKHLKDK